MGKKKATVCAGGQPLVHEGLDKDTENVHKKVGTGLGPILGSTVLVGRRDRVQERERGPGPPGTACHLPAAGCGLVIALIWPYGRKYKRKKRGVVGQVCPEGEGRRCGSHPQVLSGQVEHGPHKVWGNQEPS